MQKNNLLRQALGIALRDAECLPQGFPTHTIDVTGQTICLGDTVGHDFDDDTTTFVVVFEDNAFRKKYKKWGHDMPKPLLAYGREAINMRFKVIKRWDQ